MPTGACDFFSEHSGIDLTDKALKILHIITGLQTGGAETMLLKLVRAAQQTEHEHIVVSLMNEGTRGSDIEQYCPLYCIGLKRGRATFPALLELSRIVKEIDPDLLQGWMYHGNLAAFLIGKWQKKKVYWNIRDSGSQPKKNVILTRLIIRVSAWLSGFVDRILVNSHQALRQHQKLGFSRDNWFYIPNGFELDHFFPAAEASASVEPLAPIPPMAKRFVHVARFHPMKNHVGLIEAVSRAMAKDEKIYCLLAGREVDSENTLLMKAIQRGGSPERFRLLGELKDPRTLYWHADYLILSSLWGEAFPNVLGEAMACGLPCITTDVGDSAAIVGDLGWVCPFDAPEQLSEAIYQAAQLNQKEYAQLSTDCCDEIRAFYNITKVCDAYHKAYQLVLSSSGEN